jgi:hypothetical protein
MMQAVLSLVAAEQGISIVPACVFNFGYDGVQLRRIQPDDVKADLLNRLAQSPSITRGNHSGSCRSHKN